MLWIVPVRTRSVQFSNSKFFIHSIRTAKSEAEGRRREMQACCALQAAAHPCIPDPCPTMGPFSLSLCLLTRLSSVVSDGCCACACLEVPHCTSMYLAIPHPSHCSHWPVLPTHSREPPKPSLGPCPPPRGQQGQVRYNEKKPGRP